MGSDRCDGQPIVWPEPFQSTLPVWGATAACTSSIMLVKDFNPRSLYGERLGCCCAGGGGGLTISIHAPCMGSDADGLTVYKRRSGFQSTLPVWGATCFCLWCYRHWKRDFNPRSLYGERLDDDALDAGTPLFQSTLPVWGATADIYK